MSAAERRRERRYVVEGVSLMVDGERHAVIDLSYSAARIACTVDQVLSSGGAPLVLEFDGAERFTFRFPIRVVRYSDLYVVVGYEAPRANWEDFIKRFDTFHVDELDTALFD